MMKKEWVRPLTIVDQFVPNEYVAACGDKNRVYKFKCDAGGGTTGAVYLETNGTEGLQQPSIFEWNPDRYLSRYYACDAKHEASTKDEFLKGYYVVGSTVTPVIVWTDNGTDVHCTTNLKMDEWETTKS